MREAFDLDPKLIFLNTGSLAICPKEVMDAAEKYRRELNKNPTGVSFDFPRRMWLVAEKLADFFGANPQNLFLGPNITYILNTMILGVKLPEGSEILTTDLEYGATSNICRYKAERESLHLRVHPVSECAPEELAQNIIEAIDHKTKMLVLGHIFTGTGQIVSLEKLIGVCRERDIVMVVDGAHAPGALALDFKGELGEVDYYAGNLHKWMMGPAGTAFGLVHPRQHKKLRPLMAGWNTFETPSMFQDYGGDSARFAQRFQIYGTLDYAPYLALSDLVDFWHKWGAETIRARMRELQDYTEEQMAQQLNLKLISPKRGGYRGPLLTYELPQNWQNRGYDLMYTALREYNLQIVNVFLNEKAHLRLSPHIYNTEGDIERGVQVLKQLLN